MNLRAKRVQFNMSRAAAAAANAGQNKKITGCCQSRRQTQRLSWWERDTGRTTQEHSPPCWRPPGHTVSLHTRKTEQRWKLQYWQRLQLTAQTHTYISTKISFCWGAAVEISTVIKNKKLQRQNKHEQKWRKKNIKDELSIFYIYLIL